MMQDLTGDVVRDSDVAAEYPQARVVPARALQLWPQREWLDETLVSFSVPDLILTSCFVSIDPQRARMFLNQSYRGVETIFPTRFQVEGQRFALTTEPIRLSGSHVVLGGPIEGVWYHWLFNWCPRLLLLRRLQPSLLASPDLRFLVHPAALWEPYRSVLETFGIPSERLIAIDPECDYQIERAILVSFLDQHKLYPEQIRAFADHLLRAWDLVEEPATPGVFASRQALTPPKRRIDNFADVEPVLDAFGLQVVNCGALSAREQARVFRAARLVVGGHGSDLGNLLYCRPGTKVLVLENAFSIAHNLHVGLEYLCEVLDLEYHLMETPAAGDDPPDSSAATMISRDYRVDPECLAETLRALSGEPIATG